MTDQSAHHSNWETSEVVFGIPLLISFVLTFVFPLPIAYGLARSVLLAVGILFIVLGITLIVITRRTMSASNQPTDPGKPTTRLILSGVFSISRNPLYLGLAILVAGIALAVNSFWTLACLLPALYLCQVVLIFPEERYLSIKFGDEYSAYKNTTLRWFGRKHLSR